MPFIKTKNIHVTPNRSLNYICDAKKTQGGLNIVSVNCMPDARNTYEDMKRIYEYYSNRRFNEPKPKTGQARVKMIHYIQSFDPKDNISIDTAQQIGLDTVKEMFGENVQAVIATHDDTDVLHNHIMINAYALDGKHFLSNKTTLKKIKSISDEVCKRYGIEPYRKNGHKQETKISGYHEWKQIKKKSSWKQHIRDRIDELVCVVDSFEDVMRVMEREGFVFKRGKSVSVSVKAPERDRYVQLKTLGENYTPERIKARIAEETQKLVEKFAMRFYYIALNVKNSAGAYQNTKPVTQTYNSFMNRYTIIVRENLRNIQEVEIKLKKAENIYAEITQQVRELKEKIKTVTEEIKLAEHYFDEMSVLQRGFPRKERDKTAVAVVKKHGLKRKEDISELAAQLEKYNTQLAELTEQMSSTGGEVRKYRDIIGTFEMTNDETYFERLMREDKDNISREDWDKMIEEQMEKVCAEIEGRRSGLYPMEDILWKKLDKLRTMNVPSTEITKIIRALAIMRIDYIRSRDDVHKIAGKIKTSAEAHRKDYNNYTRLAAEYDTALKRIGDYLQFRDNPGTLNADFFARCKEYADKYQVENEGQLKVLISQCDEFRKKAKEALKKANYYKDRALDYDSIMEAVMNINIYPPEIEPEEEKKPEPMKKKKLRR